MSRNKKFLLVVGILGVIFVAGLTIYSHHSLTFDDVITFKKMMKLLKVQHRPRPARIECPDKIRKVSKAMCEFFEKQNLTNKDMIPFEKEKQSSRFEFECPEKIRNVSKAVCETIKKQHVTKRDKDVLLYILGYIMELAKKNKWTHFIFYGTLLGSWRHHGFIPYDTDMDMYFDLKDRNDIISAIEAQTEFVAKQVLNKEIKLYSNSKSDTYHYYKDIGRWRSPYMDLYFYTTTKTHVQCASYAKMAWLKGDIFPLHDRPFEHFTLPAPKNPLRILQIRYGKTSKCKTLAKTFNCSDLEGVLPFVHRKSSNGIVTETLKIGERVIHVKNVTESSENMPKSPFSLENL